MPFTKNYYTVLGLAAPPQGGGEPLSQAVLRKAYKAALLAAHPDKTPGSAVGGGGGGGGGSEGQAGGGGKKWSIDDIKEALAVLSDAGRRREFERWVGGREKQAGVGDGEGGDFVLGLEGLDLSDFEAGMGAWVRIGSPEGEEGGGEEGGGGGGGGGDSGGEGESLPTETPGSHEWSGEGEMEWTRACRCGAEKGYRIQERELEEAELRGETEVLVGCEGCSLWVRVGFDVEVG